MDRSISLWTPASTLMSNDWRSADCPAGVTKRILLMRHGETEASARGRCYGKLDIPLSDEGKRQVERATTLIRPLQPDLIISSPRIRASDSAAIVADACRVTVHTDDDFAELDFGDCEGKRYEDVEREDPEFYASWMANPTEVTFPNGESYQAMETRVVSAYQRLVDRTEPTKLLLVAHGGVNRIVLSHILDISPKHIFRLEQTYAGLSCIDYFGNTPLLRVMNAVA